MKAAATFGHFLTAAAVFSSTVSAWPKWLPDIDSLVVRQDDKQTTSAASQTASQSPSATATGTDSGPQTTNLNTGGQSSTASDTASGTGKTDSATGTDKTSDTKTTHTTFSAGGYAGGAVMVTPATTAGTPLYRIGETVTWQWNYTSVSGTPSAVDLIISCSTATQSWTVTGNLSYASPTYTWDTNAFQSQAVQNQLLTAQYTLIIVQAGDPITATAEAGYLAPASPLSFGLYSSRPYQNLSDYSCVTCSAGNGNLDRKALGFATAMATITVLSFTWFVAGFGALA